MGRSKNILTLLAFLLVWTWPASLLADDTGLIVSAGLEKKIDKKWSAEFEAEFRSRNDFRTADRVALGLSASYKVTRWLKADAGYQLLIDNNHEKLTYNLDGNYNNWRPSYWGTRHRVYASLQASYKWNRVTFSLRERWRYTYRPETTTTRYDFDNEQWEDTQVRSKGRHMLRSRLKAEWNVPKCKLTPWASAELFNDMSLAKTRWSLGGDYSLQKKHKFTLFYRYQHINGQDDDGETGSHYVGLGYAFKF
ncbi:MAG: DUF2490 domain-containing protein [Muribaculaceae bacterium]|nr:DUF2490 domain-containing protein [Muribaculaceae bacterium]